MCTFKFVDKMNLSAVVVDAIRLVTEPPAEISAWGRTAAGWQIRASTKESLKSAHTRTHPCMYTLARRDISNIVHRPQECLTRQSNGGGHNY